MSAIESKTIEHEGFSVRIDVVPDSDSTPFDADCYSGSDIQAWRDGEWIYVGFIYTATREGVELGSASIWGTEWDFPGGSIVSIESWMAENCYHPDLLDGALTEARATLARLVTS